MTPQEFEKIAVWMGWHKDHLNLLWFDATGGGKGCRGYVSQKTSLTGAECIEALNRLVEKGIMWNLDNAPAKDLDCGDEGIELCMWAGSTLINGGYQPTISAAVEEALLKLIAAEGIR